MSVYHRVRGARSARILVVSLLLCALTGATIGFPVWVRPAKDRSSPFPCQDRVCGCMDAAACWARCCCHTNAEKLAWAEEHGVTPPQFVVEAARRERGESVVSCCASGGRCESPAREDHGTIASTAASTSTSTPTAALTPAAETSAVRFVLAEDMRRCQGQGALWLLLSHALPAQVAMPLVPAPLAGQWLQVSSDRGTLAVRAPDSPPPRAAI
ncbi:MAG: hypothetical protein MUF06_09990 [Pirellulaceae bacterium]|nr:hypothetical protein [Pirellulaceae bacterium]